MRSAPHGVSEANYLPKMVLRNLIVAALEKQIVEQYVLDKLANLVVETRN